MTLATQSERTSKRTDRVGAARVALDDELDRAGATVQAAAADLAAGRAVIVVDTSAEDHAGYLLAAARKVTAQLVAFLVRHSSGVLCVPMDPADCDRLGLPLMVRHNENPVGAAFTVSVDAVAGVTTGISAADRATTIRRLGDPAATSADFSRPGHVFPMRARPGGVLERPRWTEAAVDLLRFAGMGGGGVIAAIVNDDSSAVTEQDLAAFAATHRLGAVTIEDIVAVRAAGASKTRRCPRPRGTR